MASAANRAFLAWLTSVFLFASLARGGGSDRVVAAGRASVPDEKGRYPEDLQMEQVRAVARSREEDLLRAGDLRTAREALRIRSDSGENCLAFDHVSNLCAVSIEAFNQGLEAA